MSFNPYKFKWNVPTWGLVNFSIANLLKPIFFLKWVASNPQQEQIVPFSLNKVNRWLSNLETPVNPKSEKQIIFLLFIYSCLPSFSISFVLLNFVLMFLSFNKLKFKSKTSDIFIFLDWASIISSFEYSIL